MPASPGLILTPACVTVVPIYLDFFFLNRGTLSALRNKLLICLVPDRWCLLAHQGVNFTSAFFFSQNAVDAACKTDPLAV